MMKILGYVTNDGIISQQDAGNLTHINVAFAKLRRDGEIEIEHLKMNEQMEQIRRWNPAIRIVASIVPKENEPDAFTLCAGSETLRRRVAASCAKIVKEGHYDGVDFDWEYPCVPSNGMNCSPDDRHNFTLLCREVRGALDALDPAQTRGRRPLVTIAAGADLYYVRCVELAELSGILDFICLMTYDLKCGFHALAGHHTALYSSLGDIFANSCDQALTLFWQAGVPKEKLLMGAAFYSRKWESVQDRNHGFLQISKNGGGYGPSYGELTQEYIQQNGYTRYWDEEAKAPWLFNGSTFLSYDDEESIRCKCKYVKDNGYGGIFYWEHSCDPSGRLLAIMSEAL